MKKILRKDKKSVIGSRLKIQLLPICTLLFSQFLQAANQLEDVQVTAGENGKTLVTFALQDSSVVTDFNKQTDALQLRIKSTEAKESLLGSNALNPSSLGVKNVSVTPLGDDVGVTLNMNGPFNYDYYQFNNLLTVELQPYAQLKTQSVSKPTTSSKHLSINFQDIPIRSVLQMVAEHNGLNIVVSDTVKGNLTLRLNDVTWQRALDTILRLKGLDKRQSGNILLIAPKSEIAAQEYQALESRFNTESVASLTSDMVKLNYASAEELVNMLESNVGSHYEGNHSGLLSDRGSVVADLRTNTLIVRDLPQNVRDIISVVKKLDVPVNQVEIEARIVTVQDGVLDEIGVRWGISQQNGSFGYGGSIDGNLGWNGNINTDSDSGSDSDSDDSGFTTSGGNQSNSVDDFLNVNLGATSANAGSIAFQVAKLGNDLLLDLELSALQSESKVEIISSPRLVTTNKRPAYIEQGTEIPYLESSSSGAASIAFKKAVLSLSVTPQITSDNKLVLDLLVTQDQPSSTVKSGTGEAVAISTQRIGTQVLVNDGDTVVLGGIFQNQNTKTVDKVPLLGDLPLVGWLFRREYSNIAKRELLIFVTPKVMKI